MPPRALIIGNSDGIGLAATKSFLDRGWDIFGISRSDSPLKGKNYEHHVADVSDSRYPALLDELLVKGSVDICLYLAGIGELLDPLAMRGETRIFEVNLVAMVKTAAAVIPRMVKRGQGHFVGISSLADELLSGEAPSYHASKAGFSSYLESLALALKPRGVHVTNVRFGFVDTKMAKGDVKPFMMSVEKAVDHLELCINKKPIRYTAPKIAIPLVKFRKLMMRLGAT